MLLLFAHVSSNAMDYVKKCQEIVLESFCKRIRKSFEKPKMMLQQPLTIVKTPLEAGTLENEAECIIHQVNVALALYKVNIDCIFECLVFVTNYDHKKRLLNVFKAKKFTPRNMRIKVTNLGGKFQVAIDIKIFKAPKKKQDRMFSAPKKAKL